MALRYIDGFESNPSSMAMNWQFMVGGQNPGRYGGNSWGNPTGIILGATSPGFDNQQTWIIGFAVKLTAITAGNMFIWYDYTSGVFNQNHNLVLNANGTISHMTGSVTGTVLGTTTYVMPTNQWVYLEWMVYTSTSTLANTCKLNINGVNVLNLASGKNTRVGGLNSCNTCQFYVSNGYVDDFYINDGTGSAPWNGFLGPQKVETRMPSGAGALTNWRPSSGSLQPHQCVNETDQDYDSTFIYSNSVNDTHSFVVPALSDSRATVNGIQVRNASVQQGATLRQVCNLVRSNGTAYTGATTSLTTSYQQARDVWATDPNTAAAWTIARANAVEIGIKDIA